jgi:hypothetical protein|tara:strand:+ start:51 stop:596 length:546 start_codon:yes stop_codon:yes gene_type:complete
MFAVSANASALLCAPVPVPRARRGGARALAAASADRTPAQKVALKAVSLALSAAVAFAAPSAATAGLNKMGNSQDAYAVMMAEMEAQRKEAGIKSLSAAEMYEEQGGACGDGYELKVVKVLGASCVCVADSCMDGKKAEGTRTVLTEGERSFGKAPAEEGADGAPAKGPDTGIKFVFTPKE